MTVRFPLTIKKKNMYKKFPSIIYRALYHLHQDPQEAYGFVYTKSKSYTRNSNFPRGLAGLIREFANKYVQ